MDDLYQQTVLDRSRAPLHAHALDHADAVGYGNNPMCGDNFAVSLRMSGDGAQVQQVAFSGHGCAISVASADLMADVAQGCSPEAVRITASRFEAMLNGGNDEIDPGLQPLSGVRAYPARVRCATLPWDALLAALDQAQRGDHV